MRNIKYLFIFSLFFLAKQAGASFPEFPMTFYGTAQYNNAPILIGSKIRAIANGLNIGEVEIKTNGIYGTSSPMGPNLSVSKFTGNNINFYYINPGANEPLQGVSSISSVTSFVSGLTKELNLGFTPVVVSSSGGGGGGNSSNIIYCSDITYSDWNVCNSKQQFRSVLAKTPNNCVLTTFQQISLQQRCNEDDVKNLPKNDLEENTNKNVTNEVIKNDKLVNSILGEVIVVISNNPLDLTSVLGINKNEEKELKAELKYNKILNSDKSISNEKRDVINRFIVYGTQTTQVLGEGERAGVVNSYFQAYGKLVNSEEDWADALKIANGRWPKERNLKTENQAKKEFIKIYGRDANLDNNIDENAIMVISYGLLPSQRNLNSEKAAIKAFKWVYNRVPVSALDWSIVRSIAYSGAKR